MPTELENSLPTIPGVVTLYDYLCLAILAYDKDKSLPNIMRARWEIITDSKNPEIGLQPDWFEWTKRGFFATAYKSRSLKSIVIAVRGTVLASSRSSFGNIIDDLNIMRGSYPASVKYLEKFYSHISQRCNAENYTISFTGHSLGAMLAELVAYKNCLIATTFESPGSLNAIQDYMGTPITYYWRRALITNYVAGPNLINACNSHLGRIVHIEVDKRKLPLIAKACLALPPWVKAYKASIGIEALVAIILFYKTRELINNVTTEHATKQFNPILENCAKFYLFPPGLWPPASNYDDLFEVITTVFSTYLKDKEPLNINSINRRMLHTVSEDSRINDGSSYSDIIRAIRNPDTFINRIRDYYPNEIDKFRSLLEQIEASDDLLVTTSISVLDIEPVLIQAFSRLNFSSNELSLQSSPTRVPRSESSSPVAALRRMFGMQAARSDQNYRNRPRVTEWMLGRINDVLVLWDGKFITTDGGTVAMWDPNSENVTRPVSRWKLNCSLRELNCIASLTQVGCYIVPFDSHFCNYVNLTNGNTISTPEFSKTTIKVGRSEIGVDMGRSIHHIKTKCIGYGHKFIIQSPNNLHGIPHFKVWNLETGQLESRFPAENCGSGFRTFFLLTDDFLISSMNDNNSSLLWKINHRDGGGIESITQVKRLENIASPKEELCFQKTRHVHLGMDANGNTRFATMHRLSEAEDSTKIAVFDTNPETQIIQQIDEPYLIRLFDLDSTSFVSVSSRERSSVVNLKLWNKQTLQVENTITWDVAEDSSSGHNSGFFVNLVQQVIRPSADYLIASTSADVFIWHIASGQKIKLGNHVGKHKERAPKIALLPDGKLIVSATPYPRPGHNNNLFLYDFSGQ